jgi:hypothetical protein
MTIPSSSATKSAKPAEIPPEFTEAQSQRIWENTRTRFHKGGRWLITEPLKGDGYKGLLARLEAKSMFKGTFTLHNFPANLPLKVDFLMTDKETTVGHIKNEVEKITAQSAKTLKISFLGFEPLNDDTNLYYGLCCHGRGGENFRLSVTLAKSLSSDEKKSSRNPAP